MKLEPVMSMDVEKLLIWTYQDQAADAIVGRYAGTAAPMIGGGSNAAMIANHISLGCRVDVSRGGARWAAGVACDIDPDAEAVHEYVRCLPPALIGLVISHAKGGTRPDWMPGAQPRPVAVYRKKDRPQMVYWDTKKNRPAYCILAYDPEPAHIAFMREVWMTWWDALASIADDLDGRLKRKVLRPQFPREPWLVRNPVDKGVKL